MGSFFTSFFIFLALLISLSISTYPFEENLQKGINLENPVIEFTPSPLVSYASLSGGSKDVLSCERVQISGKSRLRLESYANAYKITLAPSVAIPERLHSKIQICFHKNASRGLCRCESDEWRTIQKGLWSSVMSPYEEKYIDVKFNGEISGSVTVTVEEDFQRWRLICLAIGLVLLLLAPVVSSWVPFYYSSSMAIGVFLVILILLFQGMKLLPTGRKNFLYLTLYGSVVGAGSYLLHQFSALVNSILINFGLTEEMHNPVSVFVLLGIILAGAALGFWIVRKFVISDDGSVDVGIAQFVKWAMRVVASAFIFQSTLDTPLALGALALSFGTSLLVNSFKSNYSENYKFSENGSLWGSGGRTTKQNRAEFLSRSRKAMGSVERQWSSPRKLSPWSDSPVKGLTTPPSRRGTKTQRDYYSTFHKTPNRKKVTKREWENFTEESTKQALGELASTPEFTDWVIKNSDRIRLRPDDSDSDEAARSGPAGNEIRITSQGRMRSYITYAMSLLQEKASNEIVFKAMGRAINKTVTIVELIKRRIVGLHQITTIGSIDITDTWEPLEEGLLPLETTRHVSMITITLSMNELDKSSVGYQPPIPADQVKPSNDFDFEGGEGSPNARGRGRGGRGRGRRSTGNGYAGGDYEDGGFDRNRNYGRSGRGRGRGRSFRGRGRDTYNNAPQNEDYQEADGYIQDAPPRGRNFRGRGRGGYNNGPQNDGYQGGYVHDAPPQGRGRGRGRGGRGRGRGFRSNGPANAPVGDA